MKQGVMFAGVCALMLAAPLAASAGEHQGVERHYFTGLKGTYQAGFAHGGVHHLGGVAGFFEMSVVPHTLELELAAGYRTDGHLHAVPVELIAKLPFHPHPDINPFVGLGPLMSIVIAGGETHVYGGATFVAGSYFWVAEHWGLLAEVAYGFVYEDGAAHEVVGNLGVVYGW